jgi:tRNA-specific 2-thiouridylase
VVDKSIEDNVLIVDQGDSPLLLSDSLIAVRPSWIGSPPAALRSGLRCMAKIRYRQADQACRIQASLDDRLMVRFDTPQRAVAPGQFAVFYQGDQCLGGATIDAIERHVDAPAAAAVGPQP